VLMHRSWILSDVLAHGHPQFQALVPLVPSWGYPHTADGHQPIDGLLPVCLGSQDLLPSWHLGLFLSTPDASVAAKPKTQG